MIGSSSNIAEGFGQIGAPSSRRYLDTALGSLRETETHLDEALRGEVHHRAQAPRSYARSPSAPMSLAAVSATISAPALA